MEVSPFYFHKSAATVLATHSVIRMIASKTLCSCKNAHFRVIIGITERKLKSMKTVPHRTTTCFKYLRANKHNSHRTE